MKKKISLILVVVCLMMVSFTACTSTNDSVTQKDLNQDGLMSVLWIEQSGEYNALCYQAFNLAKMIYDQDLILNDSDEKRAVIVDIDETILSNMPQQAAYIGTSNSYPTAWKDWCNAAEAQPLPGAIEFLNYVVSKGGDVFYISNRNIDVKEGTAKNLKKAGFPQVDEHLILATDTSNKEPRRHAVEKTHRIVILMGDNLNDFAEVFYKASVEERKGQVEHLREVFGHKFIILPNPVYGDWESAIYEYQNDLTPAQKEEIRMENLIKFED